jgi:hypothetical protein
VSLTPHDLARAQKSVSFEKIQLLRQFYGEDMTSALLGIHKFALGFKAQPSPAVRRLAYLLHRMTFSPGKPVTLFDLLTCGKYERGTPQEMGPPDGDWTI